MSNRALKLAQGNALSVLSTQKMGKGKKPDLKEVARAAKTAHCPHKGKPREL